MAHVDSIKVPGAVGTLADIVRRSFAKEMWEWYESHKDDKLTTIKVWVISVTIRVHHVRPLFVILFGEPIGS